jgi:hypothetical protein
MRIRTPLLVTAAAATMLAGVALPASAATGPGADGTATNFTLGGGSLDVTVQTAATLATSGLKTTVADHDVIGSLGLVTVNDARGAGGTTWSATAASTAGFNLTTNPVTASQSSHVHYAAGSVDATGVTAVETGGSVPIDTSAAVVGATAATGGNTAAWTPVLTVTLPSTAIAGAYSGTVATSVA